jgi:hypothetical protein
METVFYIGSKPRLYNEDPRLAELDLMGSLKIVDEEDRRDGN